MKGLTVYDHVLRNHLWCSAGVQHQWNVIPIASTNANEGWPCARNQMKLLSEVMFLVQTLGNWTSHQSIKNTKSVLVACPSTAIRCLRVSFTNGDCRQTSNISYAKSQTLNVSRLVLQLSLSNPLKSDIKLRMKDVVRAAPTGTVPITSKWSTVLLPTKVQLILEVWR